MQFNVVIGSFVSRIAVVICFLIAANSTQAQNVSRWIGMDGNWSDATNWDNGVPNGFAIAVIDSGAGEIIQDIDGLILFGLEMDSESADIVLENNIAIDVLLTWNAGKLSGKSSLELLGSGQINGGELEATFENFGFVVFGGNGETVVLASEFGGNWINRSGSTVCALDDLLIGSFPIVGLGNVTVEADSSFTVSGDFFQTSWSFQNNGKTNVGSLSFFFGGFEQTSDAELSLTGGTADFFQFSNLSGRVSGNGSIGNLFGPFSVEVEPGGKQIGTVTTFGSIIMTPDTVSNFQIGPNLTSDLISNLAGPLQLNGILNIEALPGVTTGTYTLFAFNNASSLQVDAIQLGKVPNGFDGQIVLDLQSQQINLVVDAIDPVILGDVNQDGSVDLLDVNAMVELLADGGFLAQADINMDGKVNLLDVSGFVAILTGN